MANKYYAVVNGIKNGIYDNWDACKENVTGYTNAVFKGFSNKRDAEAFYERCAPVTPDEYEIGPGKAKIFVAGIYDATTRLHYTSAMILLNNPENIWKADKIFTQPVLYGAKNGGGEADMIMDVVDHVVDQGCYDILVCYHYAGSHMWARGGWEANSFGAKEYALKMQECIASVHFAKAEDDTSSMAETTFHNAKRLMDNHADVTVDKFICMAGKGPV